MEDCLLSLNLDGVPCIVAALETDDNLALGTEHVDNLALALVAPLSADDNCIGHKYTTCLKPLCSKAERLLDTGKNV